MLELRASPAVQVDSQDSVVSADRLPTLVLNPSADKSIKHRLENIHLYVTYACN